MGTIGSQAFSQDMPVPDVLSLSGRQLYILKKCGDCHNPGRSRNAPLPAKTDSSKLAAHLVALKSPLVLRMESNPRRQKRVFGEEVAALVAYVNSDSSGRQSAIDGAPKNLLAGAYAIYREGCRNCHIINGIGKEVGPDLKGVSGRHDKEWIIDHFKDPQKYKPDSVMPKFDKLPADELAAIADYLTTLN